MGRKFSQVKVSADKENLRIRFCRAISKEIFGVERKTLYLKLSNTERNLQIANAIATQIDNDITAKKLDISLESYLPVNSLKKEVGIAYNPNEASISLLDLFDLYFEFIEDSLAATTAQLKYQDSYRRILVRCPQNLNNQHEIVDYLYKNECDRNFRDLSNLIIKMITWGKNRDFIPSDFVSKITTLKKDYKRKLGKYRPPKFIYELLPGYVHDYDKKAFTENEAKLIIQAFEEHAKNEYYGNQLFPIPPNKRYSKCRLAPQYMETRRIVRDFIKLKLWTGCRSCEASALRWRDISSNFQEIYFRNAFCPRMNLLKSLKTEKVGLEGTEARVFPCGEKLSKLLEEIHNSRLSTKPDDYLFLNFLAEDSIKPFNIENGTKVHWSAYHKKTAIIDGKNVKIYNLGVVAKLLIEGKITQYLKPYATRSTWIMHQLNNNVPIKNVARLAGNSPETIVENYLSYVPDAPLAKEI